MNEKVEIDREELERLQTDSAELARMREPVDLVTIGYLHLDATIGGGWRVSGYPLSERKIYEGALQQPFGVTNRGGILNAGNALAAAIAAAPKGDSHE